MKDDESRLVQLGNNPEDDTMLDTDIPLIKDGLLILSYTTVEDQRKFPFVTPTPQALRYLEARGRLTPADRRVLKSLSSATDDLIEWALTQPRSRN